MALTTETNSRPCLHLAKLWRYADTMETFDVIWSKNRGNPCRINFGSLRSVLNNRMIICICSTTTIAIIHQNWSIIKRETTLLWQKLSEGRRHSHLHPSYWILEESKTKAPKQPCQERQVESLSFWITKPCCPVFRFCWLVSGCYTTV